MAPVIAESTSPAPSPASPVPVSVSMEEVMAVWREADAVCFDVDSTVIQEEGIDELAKFCGKGAEVQAMTRKAMGGSMCFRDALAARLGIIQPSMTQIREFLRIRPHCLTPGIKKLVGCLQRRNVPVFLVSGGFRCLIGPVALELNIPLQNIYANRLMFYFNGDYAGFDENEATSQNGGKAAVIKMLKKQHGYDKIIMVGDGATDLEACPPADAFIGYGGNVIRQEVKNRSKWYVTDFQELVDAL